MAALSPHGDDESQLSISDFAAARIEPAPRRPLIGLVLGSGAAHRQVLDQGRADGLVQLARQPPAADQAGAGLRRSPPRSAPVEVWLTRVRYRWRCAELWLGQYCRYSDGDVRAQVV